MAKYKFKVKILGEDGNAYNLLGICRREMRDHKIPEEEIKAFTDEATSGDYNHLLCTIMDYFKVC